MIPKIFISSTVIDLKYLREVVRETIFDLGFQPIMSDKGDVGYLWTKSAEKSCYFTVKECDMVISIIGKRYGSIGKNKLSFTHNEIQTAKKNKIPIITLIEKEVMNYYRNIYKENNESMQITIKDMTEPLKTFKMIEEIVTSIYYNAILEFDYIEDVRMHIKKQFATLFGVYLKGRNPIRPDSMSSDFENVFITPEKIKKEPVKDKDVYDKATKVIIQDKMGYLREFGKATTNNSLETAIQYLISSKNIEDYTEDLTGQDIETINSMELDEVRKISNEKGYNFVSYASWTNVKRYDGSGIGFIYFGITKEKKVVINIYGLELLNSYLNGFHQEMVDI